LADVQQTVYPHKWSPISCRSSAGQGKFAGHRPTFYHCATQPIGKQVSISGALKRESLGAAEEKRCHADTTSNIDTILSFTCAPLYRGRACIVISVCLCLSVYLCRSLSPTPCVCLSRMRRWMSTKIGRHEQGVTLQT